MRNINIKRNIMQKGGLMIEALAMLGLISVVTPTMYKKSAERALEVDDINTASTMRTYMNAAETYVANNYASLLNGLSEGEMTTKEFSDNSVNSYLPYGFDSGSNKALYDYDRPRIGIVKRGNALTAFTVFPVKSADAIGQERASRIASLIGASGGYVRDDKAARGVGGMWSLSKENVKKINNNAAADKYSIVIASTDTLNDMAQGAAADNDKYLQRTKETGGSEEQWRNTMRTDLYMGGPRGGDTKVDGNNPENQRNSIRNIASLIVGSATGEDGYGLYISGDASNPNPNAYVGGNTYINGVLEAVAGNFKADGSELYYKTSAENGVFRVGDDGVAVRNASNNNIHKVDYEGNITNAGKSLNLTNDFKNGDGEINIGNNTFYANADGGYVTANLLDGNIMQVKNSSKEGNLYGNNTIYMLKEGYAGMNAAGKNSLGGGLKPSYDTNPVFPLRVGSNMIVEGGLAAGQLDTQHLRTASLSTGSAKIDSAKKWLNVDVNGVRIKDPSQNSGGAGVLMDKNGSSGRIILSSDYNVAGDSYANMTANTNWTNGSWISLNGKSRGANANIGASNTKMKITDNVMSDILFGKSANDLSSLTTPSNYDHSYRIRTAGGHVDLDNTNLRVAQGNNIVFSVRGNNASESEGRIFIDNSTNGSSNVYDVAVHGNFLVSGKDESSRSVNGPNRYNFNYLSIGDYESTNGATQSLAGVKIVGTNSGDVTTTNKNNSNVLLVNLSPASNRQDLNVSYTKSGQVVNAKTKFVKSNGSFEEKAVDKGAIYMRKGMLEVVPVEAGSGEDKNTLSGGGIVRAARFVANNITDADNNGELDAKVPQLVTNDERTLYEGSNVNYYDTYMVNPAYTSVMHDIKLTTRGGARLSDILPDFINKGIYVVTNSYEEVSGSLTHGKLETLGTATLWASPYVGNVPAPQCPPGYGRVITVTPIGFSMAEAGRGVPYETGVSNVGSGGFSQQGSDLHQQATSRYGVERSLKNNDDIFNQPEMRAAHIESSAENSGDDMQTVGMKRISVGNSQISLATFDNSHPLVVKADGGDDGYTFVLTSSSDSANTPGPGPLTFQQSTWLKAVTIKSCNVSDATFSNQESKCSGKFVNGWDVLLGFLYDNKEYSTSHLGNDLETINGHTFYWNIFPVRAHTLEAYATVYCYFDRTNIFGGRSNNSATYVDNYGNYMSLQSATRPTSYKKRRTGTNGNEAYIHRLNDPTLKYNEAW